ncbi:3887_t:CDS:10 [Diversispora eburnea]|uniref:AP-3 complex subunit delta n=3 Tax=Diversisporales TaxID=214509 RepID=A0A9N8WBI8_9GLOM|nr:3887_t:CDS:10 [Diversispora eburnea]
MFEKSLTDLIRGIRANKKNEQKYIASCLQEIRQEIRTNDPDIKATAVSKLTYLQMLGYDMSWASFHVVEVMSSPKFPQKQTGYLAATQSFGQDTDVLMLTTNLFKKDLASGNHLEVGIALNGLSHIVTPDLARDLCQDLASMLSHSRPYVRKKVVLVLYKLFLKFPEALRLSFPRLKERLDDPDSSVICAVVNVICELARKNPKNYLSLAPQLFKLLNASTNNWMLIKIIKLFGALTPLEPRLAKKLLPPITHQIQTTAAMSLLYECIHTVIIGGMLNSSGNSDSLAAMCVNKLRIFLEDPDQNLKYVGLLALSKILPTHPKLVSEHRDIILKCIDDADISIRLRSLDLLVGMVNRKNLFDIVKRLMAHLLPSNYNGPSTDYPPLSTLLEPAYRSDIIHRIIYICSQNSYSNITNFEWYIAVLVDLTYVAGVNVDELLKSQIMDVGVRVKSVRQYCVKTMQRLLSDKDLLENCKLPQTNAKVLYAAAWITGEYCSYLEKPLETMEYLVQPGVTKLPHEVQAVYIHSVLKIYAFWVTNLTYNWDEDARNELLRFTGILKDKIGMFCSCTDLEVQERAYNIREIFSIIHQNLTTTDSIFEVENVYGKPPKVLSELFLLFFSYELNPVAPKAQKKVPIPEGLDLDKWINEPLPESESSESEEEESYGYGYGQKLGGSWDLIFSSGNGTTIGRRRGRKSKEYGSEEDEKTKERRRNERRERIKNDPFYIEVNEKESLKRTNSNGSSNRIAEDIDIDSIPIVHLTMNEFDFKRNKKSSKLKKSKGSKQGKQQSSSSPPTSPIIYTDVGEMPENATLSDEEKEKKSIELNKSWDTLSKKNGILDIDFSGIANVDLSTPLGDNEKLPQTASDKSKRALREKSNSKTSPKSKNVEIDEKPSKAKVSSRKKRKEKDPSKEKDLSKQKGRKSGQKKMKNTAISEISEISTTSTKINTEVGVVEIYDNKTPAKTLVDSDDIQIVRSLTEVINEPPTIIVEFSLHNKSSLRSPLSQIAFSFESTSDIQFDNTFIEIEDMLYYDGKKDVSVKFKVPGIVGVGLSVSGNVSYTIKSDEEIKTNNDIPIRFELPLPVFMLNVPRITSEQFSTLISQTSEFPFTGSTTIRLNTSNSIEQAFQNELIRLTTIATGTHIVEQVPGAITIYGKSVQGYQVAGLAKLTVEDDSGITKKASIKIDIKCTDQAFVDGLIREIEQLFREEL